MRPGFDLERLQLMRPCRNCPFSNGPERIRFADRERAVEIEEVAYRDGFPCHKSAEEVEDALGEETFFEFGPKSQYCVGSLILRVNDGDCELPPALDNEEFPPEWLERIEPFQSEVFETVEAFFEANEGGRNAE